MVIIDNLDNSCEEAVHRVRELAGVFGENLKFLKVCRLALALFFVCRSFLRERVGEGVVLWRFAFFAYQNRASAYVKTDGREEVVGRTFLFFVVARSCFSVVRVT